MKTLRVSGILAAAGLALAVAITAQAETAPTTTAPKPSAGAVAGAKGPTKPAFNKIFKVYTSVYQPATLFEWDDHFRYCFMFISDFTDDFF